MAKWKIVVAAGCLLAGWCPAHGSAQTPVARSTLTGVIEDREGRGIPNVKVSSDAGQTSTLTDGAGEFLVGSQDATFTPTLHIQGLPDVVCPAVSLMPGSNHARLRVEVDSPPNDQPGAALNVALHCSVVDVSKALTEATLASTWRVRVQDVTNRGLAGAVVTVIVTPAEVLSGRTDQNGDFRFRAITGNYDTVLSARGYDPRHFTGFAYRRDVPATFTLRRQRSLTQGAGKWQYGVLMQGGVGLQDRSDFGFFSVGGRVSRVVTPVLGHGLLAGQGEYGVEVYPFWQSYTPTFQRIKCPVGATVAAQCSAPYTVGGRYTGVSITPIQLRYDFVHGQRIMPWIQGGGGVIWTNHKYPAVGNLNAADPTQTGPGSDTSVWNFTPQFGAGAHYFLRPRRSLDFSANAVHISSASLGDKNPGVNASLQFTVGYSWWR